MNTQSLEKESISVPSNKAAKMPSRAPEKVSVWEILGYGGLFVVCTGIFLCALLMAFLTFNPPY